MAGVAQSNLEIASCAHDTELGKQKNETEQPRAKNLALEEAIAPRVLEQMTSVENLKPFSTSTYVIVSIDDIEARRTAAQVRFILSQAGWQKYEGALLPPPAVIPEGISINSGRPADPTPAPPNAFAAEFALVKELTKAGAQTNVGLTLPGTPVGFVRVLVGLKPFRSVVTVPAAGTAVYGNMIFEP